MECGGKRSATPLSLQHKSGVALRLPPHSNLQHSVPTLRDCGIHPISSIYEGVIEATLSVTKILTSQGLLV